jgi:hypothetical protein
MLRYCNNEVVTLLQGVFQSYRCSVMFFIGKNKALYLVLWVFYRGQVFTITKRSI